ncbi:hypothetical protein [Paracoccus sp. S1E-3]|nr:hypothetical protein [Paracoccus sp. S1E-3]MBA4491201.1 hypothetical protein [Paracoccus sp. S1E-3]
MHADDRQLPHIRMLSDRLAAVHTENAGLLAVARPLRQSRRATLAARM